MKVLKEAKTNWNICEPKIREFVQFLHIIDSASISSHEVEFWTS